LFLPSHPSRLRRLDIPVVTAFPPPRRVVQRVWVGARCSFKDARDGLAQHLLIARVSNTEPHISMPRFTDLVPPTGCSSKRTVPSVTYGAMSAATACPSAELSNVAIASASSHTTSKTAKYGDSPCGEVRSPGPSRTACWGCSSKGRCLPACEFMLIMARAPEALDNQSDAELVARGNGTRFTPISRPITRHACCVL
jgi:hypothetical protein